MPLDTFICGNCQSSFTDLTEFVNHKQQPCTSTEQKQCLPSGSSPNACSSVTQEPPELIHLHMNEAGEITGMTSQGLDDEESKDRHRSTLAFLNSVDVNQDLSTDTLDGKDGEKTTHFIILNNTLDGDGDGGSANLSLLNNVNLDGISGTTFSTTGQNEQTGGNQEAGVPNENKGDEASSVKKRRGRKKAGENKNNILEAVPPTAARPTTPETGPDGKLICPQCKRTFAKERHFNTHKCLASSLYVDITKKGIDSGDDEENGLDSYLGYGDGDNADDEDFTTLNEEDEKEDHEGDGSMDKDESENKKKGRPKKRKRSGYQFEIELHKDNDGAKRLREAAESLDSVPIFKNEDEKAEFEACMDVDLTQVDHMFSVHVIEQELNEQGSVFGNTPMTSLSVYSCTVCEKVFKSVSHIRLHCITHTDLKPFRCFKCTYATNSKGNLYTHMRKHTGQYYRCTECDFKSVNKSHLVEHQMIHTNKRSQCLLCQKDYSTMKSLINHIRKYHTDTRGKEYLQTFLQGRNTKGTTIIHQCHVCNRKFKKRIDRDRHLFIHDIKNLPNVQQCELCDYWASRRAYLDKHYLKHRVIYCCCLCERKFLSTSKLNEHLRSEHADENGQESLLTECINKSLYLPEPLVSSQEGSKYVNLPQELRECTPAEENDSLKKDLQQDPATAVKDNKQVSEGILDTSNEPDNSTSIETQHPTLAIIPNSSSELDEMMNPSNGTGMKEEGNENMVLMLQNPGSDSADEELEEDGNHGNRINDEETLATAGQLAQELCKEKVEVNEDPNESTEFSCVQLKEEAGQGEGELEETNGLDVFVVRRQASIYRPMGLEKTNQSEDVVEEKNNASPSKQGEEITDSSTAVNTEDNKEQKITELIKRLGYRHMSMEIFQTMRQTFGDVECDYCGRLFYNKNDHQAHLRTHTGDKPYNCSNCSFSGNSKEQLRKHNMREHERVAFQCKECDFLAPTRTRLWNHQLKHLGINGLTCPECPAKFEGMKELRVHILNFHKDIDKEVLEKLTGYRPKTSGKMGRTSFKCPHCPKVFIRANSELQKHIWMHEGIKPFSCPICPYACRSKNNLQAHMLRHSAEKPFSCSECGKEYKSKTALRWHIRSHKTGKMFKCDKCSYEATQASHLKRHQETHEVMKRFICKLCEYSANTIGYMKIHYAKHHKGQAFGHREVMDPTSMPSMVDKQVYKCLTCGYLFGNLADLKRHLKIRHNVHMQDIASMDQMQLSQVEVMQLDDQAQAVVQQQGAITNPSTVNQQTQISTVPHVGPGETFQVQMQGGEGSQELSAVSLIQQIMGLSQMDGQTVQIVSEDGQPLEINPETIVLKQDGQMLVSSGDAGSTGSQFIIQYITPEEWAKSKTINNHSGDLRHIQPTNEVIRHIQPTNEVIRHIQPTNEVLRQELQQQHVIHESMNHTESQTTAMSNNIDKITDTPSLQTAEKDGTPKSAILSEAGLAEAQTQKLLSMSMTEEGQLVISEDDNHMTLVSTQNHTNRHGGVQYQLVAPQKQENNMDIAMESGSAANHEIVAGLGIAESNSCVTANSTLS